MAQLDEGKPIEIGMDDGREEGNAIEIEIGVPRARGSQTPNT